MLASRSKFTSNLLWAFKSGANLYAVPVNLFVSFNIQPN